MDLRDWSLAGKCTGRCWVISSLGKHRDDLDQDGVTDGVMHFTRKREATIYFIDIRQ